MRQNNTWTLGQFLTLPNGYGTKGVDQANLWKEVFAENGNKIVVG